MGSGNRGGVPRLTRTKSSHHPGQAQVFADGRDLADVPALVPAELEEGVDRVGGKAAGLLLPIALERRVGTGLQEVEEGGTRGVEDLAELGGGGVVLEV